VARLLTTGFESQKLTSSATNTGERQSLVAAGTVSYDTTDKRSGVVCASCAAGGGNWVAASLTGVLGRSYFQRVAQRFSMVAPSTNLNFQQIASAAGTCFQLTLRTTGEISVFANIAAKTILETGFKPAANTWYLFEVKLNIPVAGNGKMKLVIRNDVGDVVYESAELEANFGSSAINSMAAGHITGTETAVTVKTDDWAVNDDQGEAQNSFPGNGKVVFLKPSADVARTGWVGGAGATANLYDAINNTPPVGVALGSATDASQIKDANNNSTDTFEFKLAPYSAKVSEGGGGLIPADRIALLYGVMRGGQSSATARGLGLTLVSNPAAAEVANGLSALIAEADPTGWITVPPSYVYGPTPELGVSPVLRIRKSTATTDAVFVDLAGLMVEYEPGIEYVDSGSGNVTGSGSGEGEHAGSDAGAGALTAGGSGVELAAGDDTGSGTVTAGGSGTSEASGDGPTYRSVVMEDAPLLYWRLNESGGSEVEDRSGHERPGEYRNEVQLGAAGALEGEPDAAALFDEAKASYVKGLTYDPFSGTKTFEIWAKRKAAHEKHDHLFGGSNGGSAGVFAYIQEGTSNIRLTLNGFGTTANWEGAWPGDDQWVHAVFVIVPGGKATLYVNGVDKGEKSVSAYGGTAGNVRLSHDNAIGGLQGAFAGWLDEFAIYEGDLSGERVVAHYEAATRAPAPPRYRCLWGADMDGDVALMEGEPKARGDAPYDKTTWDRFEQHAGRTVDVVHFADPWRSPAEGGLKWDGFGTGASYAVRARGAIPMKSMGQSPELVKEVLAGKHDTSIDQWAKDAAAYADLVMIRPWWEMNGLWFTKALGPEYIQGWRYLHSRIKAIADNVLFIWCPNVIAGGIADPEPWYPGDEYVDWVGMDGYSGQHPAKSYGWRSAHKVFKSTYDRFQEFAAEKPVMICETAASEYGGSKAVWTRNLLGEAVQEEMPQIRGMVWFNWNIDHGVGRVDWPIESSPAAQAAFKAGIASSYYGNPLQIEVAIEAVRPSRVDLVGIVDPGGLPATYWFEYGETTGYGKKTVPVSLGPLGLAESVDRALSGLRPDSAYHVRLVAENELGQIASADLEVVTPAATATRVLAEPIDDTLFIELRHAGGTRSRSSGVESDAANIAQQIRTSNTAPGGHRDSSWSWARDPRQVWPDLNLVDDVVIRGRTQPLGRNVFEGMTQQFPAQLGNDFSIGANAVGHQELLNEDETWRALYVKLGFEGWQEALLARRERIAAVGGRQGRIPVSTGPDGLVWDPPAENLAAGEETDSIFYAPAGLPIGALGYRGTRKGSWSNFESPAVFFDDKEDFSSAAAFNSLTLDGAARTATFSSSQKNLMLRAYVTGAVLPGAGTQQSYDRLAAYGDTGVPLQPIEGELPGVYFHDVLAHLLSTGAPELNYSVRGDGSIVPNTSFALPDFAPTTPAPPREALERGNAYFLNNWAVWDRKTFYWHPWDPDRLTWQANIAGGARWSPVGRQAYSRINGLEVVFTDAEGRSRTAGPVGSGCDYESPLLSDSDPNNPYTRRGRRRWAKLEVSFPIAFPTLAFQIGSVVLAEAKVPQRSGTLVLQPRGAGHIPAISHPTMGALPVWAVRAGDFVSLMDWPEPFPFRIIEASYEHDSKTLTAQLDSGAARLSAILERTGSSLTFV
jgi:hypothetical protein